MIGIIGAMDIEVDGIVALMQERASHTYSGQTVVTGKLHGRDAAVIRCGIGKVNAAIAAEILILMHRPCLIVNTGVGGCLDGSLDILNVAVGESVVQYDTDNSPIGMTRALTPGVEKVHVPLDGAAGEKLLAAVAAEGLSGRRAVIASGDRFLTDGSDKKFLAETYGASVCDEESAGIAQACALAGVPCAVIRAISDSSDGEHAMEYAQFAELAAQNAVRVIGRFVKNW